MFWLTPQEGKDLQGARLQTMISKGSVFFDAISKMIAAHVPGPPQLLASYDPGLGNRHTQDRGDVYDEPPLGL